jgi:hypothetical protein
MPSRAMTGGEIRVGVCVCVCVRISYETADAEKRIGQSALESAVVSAYAQRTGILQRWFPSRHYTGRD